MSANNTPVVTPVGESVEKVGDGFLSRIREGVGKVTTKARNMAGAAMVGATALTTPTAIVGGAATTVALSENGEAATVLVNRQGLPNSTVSQPTKISGTAIQTINSTLYNSQLIYTTPQAGPNTTIDRFTLNLSAADIGEGGTLVFTFRLNAGTDSSTGTSSGTGIANTQFQVRQELRFGPAGGPSEMLAFLDSGVRTNNSFGSFNSSEEWHADSGTVTYSISNFTGSGTHHLDSSLFVNNATGVNRLIDTSIAFTPNIPEPSTPLLVGITGTLALLHRKRNNSKSKDTSAS